MLEGALGAPWKLSLLFRLRGCLHVLGTVYTRSWWNIDTVIRHSDLVPMGGICKHVDICGERLLYRRHFVYYGVPWGNGNDSIGVVVDMALGAVNSVPFAYDMVLCEDTSDHGGVVVDGAVWMRGLVIGRQRRNGNPGVFRR